MYVSKIKYVLLQIEKICKLRDYQNETHKDK